MPALRGPPIDVEQLQVNESIYDGRHSNLVALLRPSDNEGVQNGHASLAPLNPTFVSPAAI